MDGPQKAPLNRNTSRRPRNPTRKRGCVVAAAQARPTATGRLGRRAERDGGRLGLMGSDRQNLLDIEIWMSNPILKGVTHKLAASFFRNHEND